MVWRACWKYAPRIAEYFTIRHARHRVHGVKTEARFPVRRACGALAALALVLTAVKVAPDALPFLFQQTKSTRADGQPVSSFAAPLGESSLSQNPRGSRDRHVIDPTAASAIVPVGRSHLVDLLHDPHRTGLQDLDVVMNLINRYRERFGGVPAGEDNAAMVRSLTGGNPSRIALLPPDDPSINSRGELADRWGTPFFFHLLSREALEIRSAGPDKEMYTTDDLVNTPVSARAE